MVRCEGSNEVVTAYLCGEIDHHIAKELRENIDQSVDIHNPKLLILDFTDVTFMDSSGIGLIMGRYKKISQTGGRLEVQGASQSIERVIKIAGLDRLAPIRKEAKK